MDTGFLRSADTGPCSYGGGLHLTSEVPGPACLLDSSANYLYGPPFRPSPEILSTAFSSSYFSFFPILVVFGLTSVFFSLSIALFAVCTRLVDINIKLEDTYIRYILFLDRLCNHALKMADAVGEAFLHTLARISSELLDVVASFSSTTCRVRLSTFWILNQGLWVPFRLVESLFGLFYIARLGVQGKALPICAASRNIKSSPHRFHIPFRDAPRRAVESARACFLLGSGWIYARGRSLYAVICTGATLGLGLALRLPSGRIYSRAWSGAMRPQGKRPTLRPPNTNQPHHGEAVLTWCVHPSESHHPLVLDVEAHAEMSFNITLDVDIDEDGDLRVALAPEAAMQGPAITLRVLCDAGTQTEDKGPGTEEQEAHTEEEHNVGVARAGGEGSGQCENMHDLGRTSTRFPATPSTGRREPEFHARGFTFKFNPHAPSFAPARPGSPPGDRTRHTSDGLCDSARGTRLNPLAEEFSLKVPALLPAIDKSLTTARGHRLDLQTNGCSGDSVLARYSGSRTRAAVL